MSIQNEIDRINENVAAAYSAVEAKGGAIPEQANSNNLSAAIYSIPSGNNKIVKHYAKVIVGNGDTDIISFEPLGDYTQSIVRFVECCIIGFGNIGNPYTGEDMYYGTIKMSANIKPFGQMDASYNPILFRLRFSNDEGKRLILTPEFSMLSGRMMSFQGALISGENDLAAQEEGRFLRGVYADANLTNVTESSIEGLDYSVRAMFAPVQVLRGDLGYTYWIEWQTPICWTYE